MVAPALIISQSDDIHAVAVRRQAEMLGCDCIILDNSDFPTKCQIVYEQDGADFVAVLQHHEFGEINLREVPGVWWRRPQPYDLSTQVPHPVLRQFASSECQQTFVGTLSSSARRLFNPLQASRSASLKLVQLNAAKAACLKIPKTLVTNDPERARRWVADGDTIYKVFTGTDFGFFETRPLTQLDQ